MDFSQELNRAVRNSTRRSSIFSTREDIVDIEPSIYSFPPNYEETLKTEITRWKEIYKSVRVQTFNLKAESEKEHVMKADNIRLNESQAAFLSAAPDYLGYIAAAKELAEECRLQHEYIQNKTAMINELKDDITTANKKIQTELSKPIQ